MNPYFPWLLYNLITPWQIWLIFFFLVHICQACMEDDFKKIHRKCREYGWQKYNIGTICAAK